MNMQSFLKTLKTYGYSSQHIAQVMNTLFKAYTEHTFSKRIPPAKDLALFAAFRFISDEGGFYVFTAKGLTVAEALWKEKPVVGGNVGGIPLQVLDAQTGFLVDSVQECGEKTLHLLQHPEESARMGAAAREHVRQHFLSTHHLINYLRLFDQLLAT